MTNEGPQQVPSEKIQLSDGTWGGKKRKLEEYTNRDSNSILQDNNPLPHSQQTQDYWHIAPVGKPRDLEVSYFFVQV